MNRSDVSKILQDSMDQLFRNDLHLLRYDVSERSITHKLAEYLQARVPELNVDCEYNRNFPSGPNSPKFLYMIDYERKQVVGDTRVKDVDEEELKAYSTYPDIVLHRRGVNHENTLVIEAKKINSSAPDEFDFAKLCGFTGHDDGNEYNYEHGVFIKFESKKEHPARPALIWFSHGRMET
jgi:hypothetical protein